MLTIIISVLSEMEFKLCAVREFLSVLMATFMWWFAFSGLVNFWYGIFLAAAVLIALSITDVETMESLDPSWTDVAIGAVSGFLLYLLFLYSARTIHFAFPFLYMEVESVEALKMLAPGYIYVPVTLTVSVAEEFFWRGFILRRLYRRMKWGGFVLSILFYALAHVPTGNASLVFAALGAGLVWSALFIWRRNLLVTIVSHVIWDTLLLLGGL